MSETTITKALLKQNGFTHDESAPTGIDRWHKKTNGYQQYYSWVLFRNDQPAEIFVRKTVYDASGALSDTKTFSSKEVTGDTFARAEKKLGITILDNNEIFKAANLTELKERAFEGMLHQAEYGPGQPIMKVEYKDWTFLIYNDDTGTLTLSFNKKHSQCGTRVFMFMGEMWLFILKDLLGEYRSLKFESYIDMTKYNDSLELESGQEIARLEDPTNNLVVTVEVRGEVSVDYKGTTYSSPASMPKELLRLIHDGKADAEHGVNIEDNNWFEVFVWEKKGKTEEWTGSSDVVNVEGNDVKQMRDFLTDCLDLYLREKRPDGKP